MPTDRLAHWIASLSLSFPIYYKSRQGQHDQPKCHPFFLKDSLVPRESFILGLCPAESPRIMSFLFVFSVNPGSLPACVKFLVVVIIEPTLVSSSEDIFNLGPEERGPAPALGGWRTMEWEMRGRRPMPQRKVQKRSTRAPQPWSHCWTPACRG